MSELGYKSVNEISSFGLESLVWNVPDCYFIKESYYKVIFSKIVTYIYMNKAKLIDYYEVNGIKKCVKRNKMPIDIFLLLTI